MKRVLITCLIVLKLSFVIAQTEAQKFKAEQLKSNYLSTKELKDELTKHNFSKLFTQTDNSIIYGFIGDNYQRIRIKFIRITKDTFSPGIYHIYGKSMVKTYIRDFSGTITISNIRKLKSINYGVDDEYKNKGIKGEFVIIGDYSFAEDKKQNHSGIFKGAFISDFYLDKNNKVHYDDIKLNADGYTNNQFVGVWIDYKSNAAKKCNWGDFRAPFPGDLDIGAGEFSPNDKYLKFGWQSVRDGDKKTENANWWH